MKGITEYMKEAERGERVSKIVLIAVVAWGMIFAVLIVLSLVWMYEDSKLFNQRQEERVKQSETVYVLDKCPEAGGKK